MSQLRKSSTIAFVLGIGFTLIVAATPSLVSAALDRLWPRPAVSRDWVKARCFEFRGAPERPLRWESAGDRMWAFPEARFGARQLSTDGGGWVLAICPQGDGPHGYLLLDDGEILESGDDAMSVMCDWGYVRSEGMKAEYLLMYRGAYHDIDAFPERP